MLSAVEFAPPRRVPRKRAPGRVVTGESSIAEGRKLYLRDWRARNRQKIRAYEKRWRAANRDRVQQHVENFRKKDPEGWRQMHARAERRWRAKRKAKAAGAVA